MLDVLYTVLMFLVSISILIAIHEFGHYWVAKKLGVKIIRYSIGFGKPLIKYVGGADKTEYVVAAIPLGGYVKMLDEREAPVDENDLDRAFNRQKLWKRFAIVFAGPFFNFLFAVFAYWLLIMIGVTGSKTLVDSIHDGSPAYDAGMRGEYELVSINNQPTPIWDAVFDEMLQPFVTRNELTVVAKQQGGRVQTFTLNLAAIDIDNDIKDPFNALGFSRFKFPISAVIDSIDENTPASRAGIESGDKIIRVDSTTVNDWRDAVKYISINPDKQVRVIVLRGSEELSFDLTPARYEIDGKFYGKIGVRKNKESFAMPDEYKTTYQLGPVNAMSYAVHRTWNMSVTTLRLLGKLITLEMSVKNISGPVNIAVHAGKSAEYGIEYFLKFLALVSISLGILNLLPIPLLDGGHLFFYIIEMVRGKPVSEATEIIGQKIGMIFLLLLMVIAFTNDIMRFVN